MAALRRNDLGYQAGGASGGGGFRTTVTDIVGFFAFLSFAVLFQRYLM